MSKNNPNMTSDTTSAEAMALLSCADLIGGHARRIEKLAGCSQLSTPAIESAEEVSNKLKGMVRCALTLRGAGPEQEAVAFYFLANLAEIWAETVFDTDRTLARISKTMRAVERRDNRDWELDDPAAPADFKALATQLEQRFAELEPIRKRRVVAWLCSCGEVELATLYLNDLATFQRRWEAGSLAINRMDSDAGRAEVGRGDPGLTSVVDLENA